MFTTTAVVERMMTRVRVVFLYLIWFVGEDSKPRAVRAEDNSWAEAERLTDSSCTQRWVASAGFTLLAFACLQPAWCGCQPLIDEYHHLKCKRKRLCEGRHDEVPPAGTLGDTLSASSLSLFLPPLLFSTPLPPVHLCVFHPFMLLFFILCIQAPPSLSLLFFSVPPTFVLFCHPNVSLLPPPFPPPSPLFHPGVWLALVCLTPALKVSLNFPPAPCMSPVYHPRRLRSYEMSNFIWIAGADASGRTSAATCDRDVLVLLSFSTWYL